MKLKLILRSSIFKSADCSQRSGIFSVSSLIAIHGGISWWMKSRHGVSRLAFIFRTGPDIRYLERRHKSHFRSGDFTQLPVRIPSGVYVGKFEGDWPTPNRRNRTMLSSGPSRCSDYSSAMGSGQRVLSYTYYTPWAPANSRSEGPLLHLLHTLGTSQ